MTLHAASDHRSVQHIQRCEQRSRSVPLIVVGHRAAAALFHRQARLGPVKRLNLALFVDRQDNGVRRRSDIKPDDVEQFGSKPRIVGQLEEVYFMRLQAMLAPNALHRTDADANVFGHRNRGPVRGLARCWGLRGGDHARLNLGPKRRNARRTGLVAQQAGHTFGHKSLLPPPDRGLARARAPGEFHGAAAVNGQQDDLRPPDMFLRAVAVHHDHRQGLAVGVGDSNGALFAHPPDSHAQVPRGILNRMQTSDYIH